MKILISNDDGIFAPGLAALVRAFGGAGHEVVVCAPDRQRSAASHSMTFTPLEVSETALEGASKAYAISGTPVDCVKLGVNCLQPDAEFVLSGINKGYNCGSDILYSGTVGAAMEGAIFGYPAMAVSLSHEREDLYDSAAKLALALFDKLAAHPLPPRTILNVNHPAVDEIRGVRVVPMKFSHHYVENYTLKSVQDGRMVYTLDGYPDPAMDRGEDDWTSLEDGYATATVLGYDMTDHDATKAFRVQMEQE